LIFKSVLKFFLNNLYVMVFSRKLKTKFIFIISTKIYAYNYYIYIKNVKLLEKKTGN